MDDFHTIFDPKNILAFLDKSGFKRLEMENEGLPFNIPNSALKGNNAQSPVSSCKKYG